jgi:hypothetical protein
MTVFMSRSDFKSGCSVYNPPPSLRRVEAPAMVLLVALELYAYTPNTAVHIGMAVATTDMLLWYGHSFVVVDMATTLSF